MTRTCGGWASSKPALDAAPEVDAGPPPIETSRKVDVLLVVDNASNTEVAQQTLAETIPYLIDRLIHPPCVNGLGNVVAAPSPKDAPCPIGRRDFAPITDFHLAMISTSLGGHGADTCSPKDPTFQPPKNDAAHLLSRGVGVGAIPTYQNKGFLAWDPLQTSAPPGDKDQAVITKNFAEMVKGAGVAGCRFGSQLESFYRFLIEPNPAADISVQSGQVSLIGTDTTVLQQRADFARPDSALVILLLTDGNDCSIRDEGVNFLVAQGANPLGGPGKFRMPRARSACATNPGDPCCAPCAAPTPAGCKEDAACKNPLLSEAEDPINLRCFDQKRRFGADFLYPVERYVQGLSEHQIPDRDSTLVDNPLFTGNRSPRLVIFGGIVGVPWQDIAKDPKSLATGFAPPSEIDWELLLGDPEMGTAPKDALMIASIDPRTGTNPPTQTDLAPPTATSAGANPINGHERVIAARDELQYACIYPRQAPKTCAGEGCECDGAKINTNPLCQQTDGSYSPVQRFEQAQPSTRELQLIQALGDRAAVGSICAASVTGSDAATFGYKPSIDAVLRVLRSRIE